MPLDDDYFSLLGQARRRGYAVGNATLQAMERAYASSLDDISRLLADAEGPLRDHLQGLRHRIRVEWARMEGRIFTALESGVALQIEEVLGIHRQLLSSVSRRRGVDFPLVERLGGANAAALSVILSRGGTANALRSLTHAPIVASLAEVDALLERAVFRGVGAGEFTRDLAALLGGEEIIPHLPSASRLHRGRMGRLDPRRYGISEADFPAMRGLLYRSRMIAVSETNNALRETNRQALSRSGLIEAVHFQTSGIHDALVSSPDECDVLAETDAYGLGPGMYPPRAFPDGPHPHCGCTQGRVRSRRPSEWGQPPGPLPRPIRSPRSTVAEMFPHLSRRAQERIGASASRALNSGFSKPLQVPGSFATATGAVDLAAAASAVRPPRGGGARRAERPVWDLASDPDLPTDRDVFSTRPEVALGKAMEDWLDGTGTPQSWEELVEKVAAAYNVQVSHGQRFATSRGVDQVVLRRFLQEDLHGGDTLGFYRGWRGEIGLSTGTVEALRDVVDAMKHAAGKGLTLREGLEEVFRRRGVEAGRAALMEDRVQRFKTVIHELNHAMSPSQANTYRLSWAKHLEEGLVETIARRVAGMMIDGEPLASGTYQTFVQTISFWRRRLGDDAIRRLWNQTSDRDRAALVQTWTRDAVDDFQARVSKWADVDLPTIRVTHKRAVEVGAFFVREFEATWSTIELALSGAATNADLLRTALHAARRHLERMGVSFQDASEWAFRIQDALEARGAL